MSFLFPVAGLVIGVVVLVLRERIAVRRARRAAAGEQVRLRALIGAPTGRLQRGRLVLSRDRVEWVGRRRRLSLEGAAVLAAATTAGTSRARPDDVLLRLRLADGTDARLVLHEVDATVLTRRLRESSPDGTAVAAAAGPARRDALPTPRRRRWPLVLLAVSALWLLGWVVLIVGGYSATATVTAQDGEGGCDITWTAPGGGRGTGYIDCDDEAPGDTRGIWVLGPPFSGEPVDRTWTVTYVLGLSLIPVVPAGVGLWRDRPARRDSRLASPTTNGPQAVIGSHARASLPELTEDDVAATTESPSALLARLAPYATRQLPPDGWEKPNRPSGATPSSLVRALAPSLLWPVVGVALVLLLTAPAPWRWWVLHTHPTATASATSTGDVPSDNPWIVPSEVTVEYTATDGSRHRADVASTRELPKGTTVRVEYATDATGWARIDGPGDGLARMLLLAGLGLLVAGGWGGIRMWQVTRAARAIRRSIEQPPRPALALLTADPEGDPMLLVCDPVSQPARPTAVPVLPPLPHGTSAAFRASAPVSLQVRGRLGDGETVVVDVPGVDGPLCPGGFAWRLDSEELLFLLDTAGALADGLDEDDPDEKAAPTSA